ncbi:hypothetical protein MZK47_00080 [Microbacterium aerolatum]|uniref:hypothetical protein n=1 Tax=Microbacterium aerolatum TaxID=153731 RepID=UPI002000A06A|nr:hypothetical protein [Microbacterium aerolatum]MCK3768074.1 hypothetical protein [Microbacterium aerolatum]
MTETDAAADRSALVPGAHRLIRAVDRTEGPFPGALVAYEDGVAVCVDAVELAGWAGWAFSGAEHVCGVIDVRRRRDGHDALLPWCTQPVEGFLGRRRAAEAPLAAGELGTLVASLLRGVRELGADAADAEGDWWLTGDGRPLFVHGSGGSARARTAALVERIAEHTDDRATIRVLDEMATALRDRRHHDDADARWEGQLFAVAAPRALRLDVFAPERAADLAPRRLPRAEDEAGRRARRTRATTRGAAAGPSTLDAARTAMQMMSQTMIAGLSRLTRRRHRDREKVGERRRRSSTPPRSRRRPLILAGSLAALVLVVGLMWPEGGDADPAQAAQKGSRPVMVEEPVESAPATEEPSAGPDPVVSAPAEGEDPLLLVPGLLDTVAGCVEAAAEACPEALAEGVATPAGGLAAQGAAASTATLVDDYGDVAVVRLAPTEASGESAQQMLVLERRDQKWLVRDIYDVAHQPE